MEVITNEIQEPVVPEIAPVYRMIALRGAVIFPGQTSYCDLGREKSIRSAYLALEKNEPLFFVAQKNQAVINPAPKDIFKIGTLAKVVKISKMPNATVRVFFEATDRMEIENYVNLMPVFEVNLKPLPVLESSPVSIEAIKNLVIEAFESYKKLDSKLATQPDAQFTINDIKTFIAAVGTKVFKKDTERQHLLSLPDEYAQLEEVYKYLSTESEILEVEKKISAKVRKSIDKNQKEYYLREQVKAINEELGEDENEINELRERLEKKKMPKEAKEKVSKEIAKMHRMSSSSPESAVSRVYVDWMLDLPWSESSKECADLKKAKESLDIDHYGLEKVKERIVEYLAVVKLTKKLKAPILCFVGPPGVGKTSIVSSIAKASGRKFVTMSLGGVKDESEVRGHRRTYIGALPGRIINGMKQAGAVNPVFLLDEIDKMSSDFRGDPASAMLEVLDPNQNHGFKDHYIDLAYDLSKVMFVATANSLDGIPLPLLDRMEIIELSGYTYEEKLEIAKNYLVPKQVKENGLKEGQVEISDEVLKIVIANYTRESGVRKLEQRIGKICRKVAVKVVNGEVEDKFVVTKENLEELLGAVIYIDDAQLVESEVGTAMGLAWTSVGGTVLPVEVALIPEGKGEVVITGSLGDVMKESCQTALSLVKSRASQFNIDPKVFTENSIHMHFPEGATPKDGPSAGITISSAILSAFSGFKVDKSVAMTGEVTLRGKVLAIGGLKEKSLAAYRHGIKKILIPYENKKDIAELPSEVTDNLEIIPVENIDTVFEHTILK